MLNSSHSNMEWESFCSLIHKIGNHGSHRTNGNFTSCHPGKSYNLSLQADWGCALVVTRCGKTALPFSNTHLISYITKWLEREILKKKKFFWTFEVQGNPDLYFEKTCMLKGLEWGERTKHWNEDKRKRKMKKVQLSFQNYFILSPEQKLSRTQKQSALKNNG